MLGYCAVGFTGLERDDERDDVVDCLESKGHVREKDPPVAVLVLLLRRERRREERREKKWSEKKRKRGKGDHLSTKRTSTPASTCDQIHTENMRSDRKPRTIKVGTAVSHDTHRFDLIPNPNTWRQSSTCPCVVL